MNIYTKPNLYDAIHKNHDLDIKLLRTITSKISGPVLELASGTGRLTKCILDLGLEYTGLDISKKFLEVAKKKYNSQAHFVLGDMREFKLNKEFNFVFIGFNSFLHNLTIKDAYNCLKCVNMHLKKKGKFLVSIFIPNPDFLYRELNTLYPATSFFHYKNSKCRIMESNVYDDKSQVNKLTWYIESNNQIIPDEYHYSMRMYYPHEMDILFDESGFKIEHKFGDYDCSPMEAESGMQIYLCEKY
tara:strand:- start:1680 stop:2411 length:732 start_codon:yes stop_codon:yes gene_type:complete